MALCHRLSTALLLAACLHFSPITPRARCASKRMASVSFMRRLQTHHRHEKSAVKSSDFIGKRGSHVPYGRGGIRTHGTLLTYTHFPGVRLKPLGHPSQHRFAARSGESFLTDCGQLGSVWSTEDVPNGQGEIRTLDTGFTGMPVFETGAFNHSATCPASLATYWAWGPSST